MLNYIYGNSAEELNLSLSDLIKIAESVGYDVSKIKGIDNIPFVSLEYLYSNTFCRSCVFNRFCSKYFNWFRI